MICEAEFKDTEFSVLIAIHDTEFSTSQTETYLTSSKRRLHTRRIREIPHTMSLDDLRAQLETALGIDSSPGPLQLDNSLRLTLACSSARSLTATFASPNPLNRFPYPVDDGFIGVTPLYDPPEGAEIVE